MQIHDGNEPWAAKWSTCVKINAVCDNKHEFAFMIRVELGMHAWFIWKNPGAVGRVHMRVP